MFENIWKNKLSLAIALLGLFTFSFSGFAREHDFGHERHFHFRDGRWWWPGWFGLDLAVSALAVGTVISTLPYGYTTVMVGDVPYYYYDDIYYRPSPAGYVVVDHPATVVKDIPAGYQPTVVNGVTYYMNNGLYYLYTPYGYQVIQPPPEGVQIPLVAADKTAVTGAGEETFTVNIPNARGGYTSVIMRRSGKGFVGRQGEFYPEFPTEEQLKALYGG